MHTRLPSSSRTLPGIPSLEPGLGWLLSVGIGYVYDARCSKPMFDTPSALCVTAGNADDATGATVALAAVDRFGFVGRSAARAIAAASAIDKMNPSRDQ